MKAMASSQADNQDLEVIRKAIVEELMLDGMSPDEQEEIIDDFGRVALEASLLAVVETLSPEKRAEFSRLLEKDPDGLREFIARDVPDYEKIAKKAVAEEVARFREFQKNQKMNGAA
jgi:hypothetical protein